MSDAPLLTHRCDYVFEVDGDSVLERPVGNYNLCQVWDSFFLQDGQQGILPSTAQRFTSLDERGHRQMPGQIQFGSKWDQSLSMLCCQGLSGLNGFCLCQAEKIPSLLILNVSIQFWLWGNASSFTCNLTQTLWTHHVLQWHALEGD